MNINTGTINRTTLIANDIIYFARLSVALAQQDSKIEYTNLLAQIQSIAAGDWNPETILDTVTKSIELGNITGSGTKYHGFDVKAIIGRSTDRYIVIMRFVYDGEVFKHYFISGNGTLNANINIKGSSTNLDNGYWDIVNNSGSTITVKWKIIERYDAI